MKMEKEGGVFIVQVISELFFKVPPKTNTSVNLTSELCVESTCIYIYTRYFPFFVLLQDESKMNGYETHYKPVFGIEENTEHICFICKEVVLYIHVYMCVL